MIAVQGSPRAKQLVLNNGRRLLDTQDRLLRSAARIIAVFGGWRSGKTTGCALKFLANCLANPWAPEYGEDRPFSLVIGLTRAVLRDSACREIKRILPREVITREIKASDDWHIELTNGHIIRFKTAAGEVEGASACGVWIDEAHRLASAEIFGNYQMRASDALGRRFLVLVSGLAESGWLQDTFDQPEHATNPNRCTIFCRTADNHYNPPHVIAEFRSSVSKTTAVKFLGEPGPDGKCWMPREDIIYGEFSPALHLLDDPGDRSQITHLSIDPGAKGVALLLQDRKRRVKRAGKPAEELGLHVVDEWLSPGEQSLKKSLREIKDRGWRIVPGHSVVFIDPTTRPDEMDAVFEELGDVEVVRRKRGEAPERVDYGIDCVKAALCDVDDNVRLTFYKGLPRQPRSVLTAITRYHRKKGKPVRDDTVDHSMDCLRYPVAHRMPIRDVAPLVHNQR